MSSTKLVNQAADRIVKHIISRAGGFPEPTVSAMRQLCRHTFGIPARAIHATDDFFGLVVGDIGGDDAKIIYNAEQRDSIQVRVLLHELAEILAACDIPDLWDGSEGGAQRPYEGNESSADIRHQVAEKVEIHLAAAMGLDDMKSTWPLTDILRLIPLDDKYVQPRPEIERLPPDE